MIINKNPKLDILISTYDSGIYKCLNLILPFHEDIRYKISHQISDVKHSSIPQEFKNRSDITISQISNRGLSNNRNNTLRMAREDICLISDDDVKYNLDDLLNILQRFKENANMDVYQGKIRTYSTEEYKKYPSHKKKISWLNIGKISSIEIAFRKDSVLNKNIQFDINFGLGGICYPKGEEAIFISDCLKKNLNIYYFPDYIVSHPNESSTFNIIFDEKEAEYYGALCHRIFRNISWLISVPFAIKFYKRYHNNISPLQFLHSYYKGLTI